MAAVYIGGGTVAAAVPGATAQLTALSDAFNDLRVVLDDQLDILVTVSADLRASTRALQSAEATIAAQATATADAKIAIRIPAVVQFQAQLDASLEVAADLNLSLGNPLAYKAEILLGMAEVSTSFALVIPTAELNAQIDSNAAVGLEAEAQIAAVDLQLEALVAINLALTAAVSALADIRASLELVVSASLAIIAALRAALSAGLAALSAYGSFAGLTGAAGAHCFLYDGPLSGLGAAIDAIADVSSGISGAANVHIPIVIVESSDTPAVDGVDAVFRVT